MDDGDIRYSITSGPLSSGSNDADDIWKQIRYSGSHYLLVAIVLLSISLACGQVFLRARLFSDSFFTQVVPLSLSLSLSLLSLSSLPLLHYHCYRGTGAITQKVLGVLIQRTL